jgi:Helix-turn-helix domain
MPPFRPVSSAFPNLPSLLTIKDVAKILNVSVRTVHTVKKQIGYFKVRGSLRFLPLAVGDYLEKRNVKAT